MRVADIAYCAGFLDGEGYFFISTPRREYPALRGFGIRAGQIVPEPLEKLRAVLGGNICKPTRLTVTGNQTWAWSLSGGRNIRRVLPLLLPHLIVKHRAATLVLAYAETCGSYRKQNPVPRLVADERARLYAAWKGVQ